MCSIARLAQGISKKKNGTYRGRFQWHGKNYELNQRKGESVSQFNKRFMNYRADIENGRYYAASKMKFSVWYQCWIEEYKSYTVKVSTINTYNNVYHTIIEKPLGNIWLSDLRVDILQKFFNNVAKKYSDIKIDQTYAVCNQALEQAYKNDLIPSNPMTKINKPKSITGKIKERTILTREQQDLFLKYADNSYFCPLFRFALSSGMRIGEILALTWDDVDFEKEEISVDKTLYQDREVQALYTTDTKTTKGKRKIPFLNNVESLLHKQRKSQLERQLLMGGSYRNEYNLVFPSKTGKYVYASSVNVAIGVVIKHIHSDGHEFPSRFTCHSFRHTFASRAVECGVSTKVLQEVMGHSSFMITMDLYVHVLDETKHDEMKKMDGVVS